ncbi:putative disease resistance protein [Salvia divinorum]|uniref:Disease resistance protein n=1 Tax=Salvia divinorum TaxID=28513 RepID=A0ABD1HK27_SALDI
MDAFRKQVAKQQQAVIKQLWLLMRLRCRCIINWRNCTDLLEPEGSFRKSYLTFTALGYKHIEADMVFISKLENI